MRKSRCLGINTIMAAVVSVAIGAITIHGGCTCPADVYDPSALYYLPYSAGTACWVG